MPNEQLPLCQNFARRLNQAGTNVLQHLDADAYIELWFRALKEETVWLQEYSSFLDSKK
jgi:hypothetical protein